MDKRSELLSRVYLVFVLFVILAIVIFARIFKVVVIEGDKWREKGKVNVALKSVIAERGNIYSEDYNLLSTSLQFFEIHMDLTVVNDKLFRENVDSLAYYLSETIGSHKSKNQWKQGLSTAKVKGKQYYPIARKVDIDEYKMMKTFPIFREGRFRGGLIAEKFGKRVKPFKALASRTIGIDRDVDPVGLEFAFDKYLRGDSSMVLMKRVSTLNNIWVPVDEMQEIEPLRGKDVVTTLNIDMQDIVHEEISRRLNELDADKGVCVVMETATGAIKAMTNLTRYKDGYAEVYNDAVALRSNPGSTIKLASVMAMIDDGYADENTLVNLNGGTYKVYKDYLRDSHTPEVDIVTLKRAFEESSNVGIGRLAHEYYNRNREGQLKFLSKYHQFGLGEYAGIDLVGEKKPKINDPRRKGDLWSGISVPWMAHGYTLDLTPLQVLTFYNAVANDGLRVEPYLVSDIIDETNVIKHFSPRVDENPIAKHTTIKVAQELLRSVVTNGTGRGLLSDIVDISGKTGTAVVNYQKKDEKRRYNASFAGYFPSDQPKYSMIVVIYNPKDKIYGSSAAGPVFKKIAERISIMSEHVKERERLYAMNYNQLPNANSGFSPDFKEVFDYIGLDYRERKKSRWVDVNPYESKMQIDKKKIKKSTVPNIKGMGARDAIYVLENIGMKVNVEGVGKVVKQSQKPGALNKGQDITIYLN